MNILHGIITQVTASQHLSCVGVDVAGELFYLLLVENCVQEELVGTKVTLAFKESEVSLARDHMLSTANSQFGLIASIQKGIVISNITLSYQNSTISSLIPTPILDNINMREGDIVSWMISPSEISLLRSHDGI